MKNTAVIYKSVYGATKKYAAWIAEELGAELLEQKKVRPSDLQKYDLIIYGGGIYASGIAGVDLVTKNPVKNLVLFTVGLANPETTDYTEILGKNLSSELRAKVKVFHLRGNMDYKELGPVHRVMMAMMKKVSIDKKSEEELTAEDREFLKSYGSKVDFTDRATVMPLVEYIRSL